VGRLAVIGKEGTLGSALASARVAALQPIGVLDHGTHVTLYRHGLDTYVAPHRIDHAAHLRTLMDLGCDRVLALSSVGSLRVDLPVGSFVAPHDFVALDQRPVDIDDTDAPHVIPGFSDGWRQQILTVWRRVAETPIVDRGIYWQANGPRFETPAEIRLVGLNSPTRRRSLTRCQAASAVLATSTEADARKPRRVERPRRPVSARGAYQSALPCRASDPPR
jgi:hypothetical protein